MHGDQDDVIPYDENLVTLFGLDIQVDGSYIIHETMLNLGNYSALHTYVNQGHTPFSSMVFETEFSSEFLYEIVCALDSNYLLGDINFDNTDIDSGSLPSREIADFLSSEGTVFDVLKAQAVWSRVTLNRGIFPTAGQSQSFAIELAIPGSSITYGRATYRHRYYRPIFGGRFIIGLRGEIGALEAYGDTKVPPFFEHFYAGGITSVRGFRANTLGPRATQSEYILDAEGNPMLDSEGQLVFNPYYGFGRDDERSIGGAYLIEGGFDFIFGLPFLEDQRSVRTSFFIDTGNVYEKTSNIDLSDLRMSAGVGFAYLSPIGAIGMYLSTPILKKSGDVIENFGFSLGTGF